MSRLDSECEKTGSGENERFNIIHTVDFLPKQEGSIRGLEFLANSPISNYTL